MSINDAILARDGFIRGNAELALFLVRIIGCNLIICRLDPQSLNLKYKAIVRNGNEPKVFQRNGVLVVGTVTICGEIACLAEVCALLSCFGSSLEQLNAEFQVFLYWPHVSFQTRPRAASNGVTI